MSIRRTWLLCVFVQLAAGDGTKPPPGLRLVDVLGPSQLGTSHGVADCGITPPALLHATDFLFLTGSAFFSLQLVASRVQFRQKEVPVQLQEAATAGKGQGKMTRTMPYCVAVAMCACKPQHYYVPVFMTIG
ncbi:hypothetical protein PWT90_04076 [Aphanocladium album]|nr:hypothetical protein PWT90_04076 [Aphanocladium album]